MFEIETKNLKISEELNRKIDMICRFACVKYEFIPGNIKSIKNTNIAYVKPHILKVKVNNYLILEKCDSLGFKFCSLRDFLWFKQGHIPMKLPKCVNHSKGRFQKRLRKVGKTNKLDKS